MPFCLGPFGTLPFASIVDRPLPALTAAAAIAAGIVFTVEVYPASGSPIYAATQEFATLPTDYLPNIPFAGTLQKALRHRRSVIDGSKIGGMSSSVADIVLDNPSGDYDAYANLLDGAQIVVRMGQVGLPFDRFVTLHSGIVDGGAIVDEETMVLHLQDDNKRLEIPAQPSVYGGTGGIDGDSNAKGKRKPIILGTPPNLTLQLIDAVYLVYQGHDGTMTGWAHIYDTGVELTVNATADYASYAALTAATITPGRWASCNALGIIRLGARPAGQITGTPSGGAVSNGLVAGSPTVGTALTDTASLVHWLITNSGANLVVDAASVLAVKAAQPAAIGYFIGPDDNKTLRQAIDELMYGILGWAGFRRDRTFDMGLIAVASGTGLAAYTTQDFFTNKQVQLPSIMNPPPYRVRAPYSLNWTIQQELDSTIDASTQTLRRDKYSIAISTNASLTATIRAAHPQAVDPEVWPSFFVNSADAVAFSNTTLSLLYGRALYETVVPADAYALNLSNPVSLTDDRYLLNSGVLAAIVSIDDDTTEEEATLQLLV
jgi:hypothetical protein